MLELDKEEFVEEIKAEMMSYEEITEEDLSEWLSHFEDYINDEHAKKIQRKGPKIMIRLKDESEFFQVVDRYLAAIDKGEKEKYWQGWTL